MDYIKVSVAVCIELLLCYSGYWPCGCIYTAKATNQAYTVPLSSIVDILRHIHFENNQPGSDLANWVIKYNLAGMSNITV